MFKFSKSKILVFTLIFSFLFTSIPVALSAEEDPTGNLTGFIYEEDEKTPVENAVVKIRNITTGEEFSSEPTNELGVYKIENIPIGVYLIGVVVDKEKYNINMMVEIKKEETAKISCILIKKKALIAGLFPLPCFAATLISGGGVVYGIVKLTEEEEEVSPIK